MSNHLSVLSNKRIIIVYYINSLRSRKLVETLGGLPNPSHTTILEMYGNGECELYVNGNKLYSGYLEKDKVKIIPEIELEKGFNSSYVVFPKGYNGNLRFIWKDNNKKDETEFDFV